MAKRRNRQRRRKQARLRAQAATQASAQTPQTAQTAQTPPQTQTRETPAPTSARASRPFIGNVHPALAAFALAAMVALAYFPATHADFIWDDIVITMARPIHDWAGLWQIWFAPRSLTDFEGHYWPLLYSTFWLEHKLWGLNPIGYHIANMFLHGMVTLMLWRLLVRFAVPAAWLAAAIFALHPVHVESVVWVIGRKDLLASLFYLATVHCYLRYVDTRRRGFYLGALVLLVGGLLCKSILVTLPAALLIFHWWKSGRISMRDMTRIMPFALIVIFITIADVTFYKNRDSTAFDFSTLERMLLAAKAAWFYFAKMVWPSPLPVIYPRWSVDATWGTWSAAIGWACAVGGGIVLTALWRARRRIGRGALACALFFLITLSPSLGFIDFGYMLYSFVADRYQYLAGIGVIVIVSVAASRAISMRQSRMVGVSASIIGAAVLGALAVLTWQQTTIYRDNFTFYSHILSHDPNVRYINHSIGQEYHRQERYDEALAAFRTDLALAPTQPSPDIRISKNHSAIGRVYEVREDFETAERHYRQAVYAAPQFTSALDNLSAFMVNRKRYREALPMFEGLLDSKPNIARFHAGYGAALSGVGRYDESMKSYDRALELEPNLEFAREARIKLQEFLDQQDAGNGAAEK